MCVIACCVKRQLTKKEFENCFASNDDGVGISWSEKGINKYVKGLMDVEEAWDEYRSLNIRKKHVVHFRLASAGGVCEELTHPFACDIHDDNHLVYAGESPLLSHNGTVSGWRDLMLQFLLSRKDIKTSGRISDTRFTSMLVDEIGTAALELVGGKWALFDKNKIFVWGDFEEDNGILFSNSSFKTTTKFYHYPKSRNGYGWSSYDHKK